ncbi:hypothetical protein GIB67_027920 [Kingdonia uniflora]|uniref:Protein cereblon n=1 Tax=Kingdonia uniflora TaxID=39325 RepID=A0A7J7LGM7_9MAGN|nr:hypothetical protein GIB67_027920 [Kingdonia uniflora]
MEDDWIMESERLQIEHIRELDMEELQIEEVDDTHVYSSDDDFIDFFNQRGRGDDGGAGEFGGFTFDTCLASLHTYLGEVDDTHHKVTFLEGGAVLTLPMFYLEGVVLFPEATLPLTVVQPRFKAAVEKAMSQVDAPNTIGVVHVHRHPDDGSRRYATVGTTAEIRQFRRLQDGSINVLTRGQQRFHVRRRWVDVEGSPFAEIQIVQEDLPLRTPRDAFGQKSSITNMWNRNNSRRAISVNTSHVSSDEECDSDSISQTSFENDLSPETMRIHQSAISSAIRHDRIDEMTSSDDDQHMTNSSCSEKSLPNISGGSSRLNKRTRSSIIGNQSSNCPKPKAWVATDSKWLGSPARSYWPYWVYRMFDSYCLAQRVAVMWKQMVGTPSMDDIVNKPDLLSFDIASKMPVSISVRQELLEIDGICYRLRREIELLESFDRVRCKTCQALIARRTDILVMSADGPLGAYVNPHGYVHEIMTFNKVSDIALRGHASKQCSWFPGYAWTIANCASCESHAGWLFTATKSKLKPKSFWAIRSAQVADDIDRK